MKIDVSLGELVDKITILAIKLEKISDAEKLANIRKEYELLYDEMAAAGITEAAPEYKGLYQVNRTLWEVEDRIRIKEAEKAFDDEFIALARSVYFNNDKRAEIKREVNIKYGSELIEEKSYAPYT